MQHLEDTGGAAPTAGLYVPYSSVQGQISDCELALFSPRTEWEDTFSSADCDFVKDYEETKWRH